MMAESPLLQLEEITKNFGAIQALRGISFAIGRGEVVALLGDNGAGKSTLVKIISGGLEQTSGRIVFEGAERKFRPQCRATGDRRHKPNESMSRYRKDGWVSHA